LNITEIDVFPAMPNLNLSGSLNILRLFANPALCLPHHTVSSFDKIPVPLSEAFTTSKTDNKRPDIRAIVLDKDNCFAIPHQNDIFPANKAKFDELRQAYPGSKLLIVSNSSGTGADPGFKDAELLEKNTGVTVLRHTTKKPGCSGEIMDYFRSRPDSQVTKPEQVAIVGDRLFTDMMMANMMGAHSLWVRDGVVEDRNIVSVKSNLLSMLAKSRFAFYGLSLWKYHQNRDKLPCYRSVTGVRTSTSLINKFWPNLLVTLTREDDNNTCVLKLV
jgi:phosphatidylglycerophosphatase GEP4